MHEAKTPIHVVATDVCWHLVARSQGCESQGTEAKAVRLLAEMTGQEPKRRLETPGGETEDKQDVSANPFSPRVRISNDANVRTQHNEVLLPVVRVATKADHGLSAEIFSSSRLEPRIALLLLQRRIPRAARDQKMEN